MSVSLERLARNQVLFREVNDRIREVTETFGIEDRLRLRVQPRGLRRQLALAVDEYEAVRSTPTLFVVARGHETPEVENVVDANERFAIVEKTHGVEFAIRTDPRARRRNRTG